MQLGKNRRGYERNSIPQLNLLRILLCTVIAYLSIFNKDKSKIIEQSCDVIFGEYI